MNNPELCMFAHGEDDITLIDCKINHSDICDNNKMQINLSDFIIYKKQKIKKKNTKIDNKG